ncbi:cyclic nucleotide-binding protein [Flavobacterium akiainvivens]|uniref:Cyclic nucleotide-binding protein n=1 Tax=Flavobacterium akiainvivens TaxID=1202724 RepID=A0A0M8M8N8_9FLAO|nr:Crp/Fnr family transcriptional regulator [Flavobacterium akiainvivens]KOS04835.1 cyclic nucleotide-binding protein [Flavobacterium akiainvivens]SFQ43486.1 cAMP-binding domain of CRP or a regulatory subunit of cAMP-dependent protein kinases [Flavobacterium akiainvivens]
MIQESLLEEYGAQKRFAKKGETFFNAGETPRYFYQVARGEVKMNNFNDEGKEFIQGIFTKGMSFGEPPLFIEKPYPANAEAITDAEVYVISKEAFFEMLRNNPDVNLAVSITLSQRLYFKSIMASEISSQDAGHRIIKLIDYFKEIVGVAPSEKFRVTLTRQQIADLTGLRVETVIRAIKTLERKGALTITDRKIFR